VNCSAALEAGVHHFARANRSAASSSRLVDRERTSKALPGVSIVEPGFIRDEGMHVDRGASLPWGFRTSTPHQVARAVIRAIERNVAETVVAPPEQRLAFALGRLALAFNAKGWSG
jgi:hypothetical protein